MDLLDEMHQNLFIFLKDLHFTIPPFTINVVVKFTF